MNAEKTQRKMLPKQRRVFFVLVFLALASAFLFDQSLWQTPSTPQALAPHNAEFKVYGRLAKSKQDGPFSAAGLLGFCYESDDPHMFDHVDSGKGNTSLQIQFYRQGRCPVYFPYKSNPGLIGFVFYLAGHLKDAPPFYRAIVASALAMVVTLWLVWFSHYSSLAAAGLSVVFFLCFKWFIFFGDNLGLVTASMYLPMVTGLFLLHRQRTDLLAKAVFITMTTSLLVSGPEYVLATVFMCFLPIVFYSIHQSWPRAKITNLSGRVLLAVIGSGALVGGLLMLQLASVESLTAALNHFSYTVGKRTLGDPQAYKAFYANSLRVPLAHVLSYYLNVVAVSLGGLELNFGSLIGLLSLVSLAVLAIQRWFKRKVDHFLKSFLALTWASVLAPLSWLIVFKPHAHAHVFMDPIVWHLPFAIFLAMLLAHLAVTGLGKLRKHAVGN